MFARRTQRWTHRTRGRDMNKFWIVPNYSKPQTIACAGRIAGILSDAGASCGTARAADGGDRQADADRIPEDTECVIVLGGDGTLIRVFHDLAQAGKDIPVIGVNLGHIGYLAETDEDHVGEMCGHLLRGDYFIENRMRLTGKAVRNGRTIYEGEALNDIILTRRETMKMVYFSLYVDGMYLSSYAADGMITATPTGSTAYNLSAGGPIVMPTSKMIVLTPICPHTMINARSIVIPSGSIVEMKVERRSGETGNGSACVNFDAGASIPLLPEDRLEIRRAEVPARMVRIRETGFLETLRKKLDIQTER